MGRKKELFLVIDTETCNSLEQPLCYDIGYAICDRDGNIYRERSFIVAEVFLGMQDTMNSAYYAEKIPQYWEDIKNRTREIKSIFSIRKQIKEDIKNFSIRKVGAYNMAFDKRALNATIRYCSKSLIRWFFPFGTIHFCIWSMACQTVLNTASYVKFAEKNGLISPSDNILTSAESCYKFLTQSLEFVESHTGLEDVKIEVEIMAKCYKMHKKLNTEINSACWRIPQRKRKEMNLKKILEKGLTNSQPRGIIKVQK